MSEQVSGVFVSEHEMNNMKMERIVISNPAIIEVLKLVKLPKEDQEEAVDNLVARTPSWEDLDDEDQLNRIKAVLTQETCLYYLQAIETIRPSVDFVEVGVDEEGSIVVYAYYTSNRQQRRNLGKNVSKEEAQRIFDEANILGGLNITELAQRKMAAMKVKPKMKPKSPGLKEPKPKVIPFKVPKKPSEK